MSDETNAEQDSETKKEVPQSTIMAVLAWICGISVLLVTLLFLVVFCPIRIVWACVRRGWSAAGDASDGFHGWWFNSTRFASSEETQEQDEPEAEDAS
jgi:hypothetical protein